MEIKIQIRGRVFSLNIGRDTKWFSQMPLISLTEEFYDAGIGEVTYAKMLFSFLYEKKRRLLNTTTAE